MLLCENPDFVEWRPDFSSSGQESPTWTRLQVDSVVLANAMEAVRWTENPVQVHLCEACGWPGCAAGGYVQIGRLGAHVLWCPVDADRSDQFAMREYTPPAALLDHGAVVIPSNTWDGWRTRFPNMPTSSALPPLPRGSLARAWLLGLPASLRVDEVRHLLDRVHDLAICATNSTLEEALAAVARLMGWLQAEPDEPVSGRLVPASAPSTQMEAIYLDLHVTPPWTPFMRRGDDLLLAFGEDWVLDEAIRVE